ncbi:aladin [Silene latifolia]|uniref:aladin n=1 Tax=Silene latifolia TaxID=37657 RepID=UPI003D7874B5
MPSFPPPASVTICEINRHLITADAFSDDIAKDTYAKLTGLIFRPVEFQADDLRTRNGHNCDDQLGRNGEKGFSALVASFKRIFHPNDVHLLPKVNLQGVSWHQHKYIMAFISGSNQVTIRDYEDSEGKDPSILQGDFQQEVKLVEWRPNSGRTLSVACKGGICIWAASYPGNPASVRPGAASFVGAISKGSGMRWTLVDFLKGHDGEHISSLSWSPDGRYLATGSYESSAFTIWDVSQGIGTPIRRGLGGISMLKWSPSGDYFFSAKFDGTFYLWETVTWTSQPWSSTSGFVTGATWDPESRMILLAFSGSSTLGSVHFASKPPSLVAHLLPVDLPEIANLTGSQSIEKIAWDGSGERLAVSFKEGDESYQGLIAIYDVRRTPLIAATLFGFIRGPGENPKPLTFSFHDKFKQGPLLSVCWSTGLCCTYPLLFRSHVIP